MVWKCENDAERKEKIITERIHCEYIQKRSKANGGREKKKSIRKRKTRNKGMGN